ncbi:MAG: DUF3291 domain-containing protein [Rhodocyclaceae bacterium]
MSSYHLAQLNIATMKAPLDSPVMADFVANIDRINALAEQSPGFVWRLKDEHGDATAIRPFGDDVIVNLSVWKDVAALSDFAFKSGHVDILRRRREWFEKMAEAYAVLWWVPAGHRPDVVEAADRLALLRERGASAAAFTFREAFAAPDALQATPLTDNDTCPAS